MLQRYYDLNAPLGEALPSGDGCETRGPGDGLKLDHPWLTGLPVFVPETYSPTYQYPLVCVLHDHDRSERDLWRWFPAISDQNYLGLGIRGPFPARSGLPGQYRWRGQRPDASWGAISAAITDLTREYSVHPDRILLLGSGNGGVIALQQYLLSQLGQVDADYQFAGVICDQLPAWWPRLLPPVPNEIEGRVLLLDGYGEGESFAAIDALREAGCNLTLREKSDTAPEKLVNRWIMSAISTAIF
ncbi:hypothetical protein [Planctomicrobium piriforme]|uniref:Predicted esterase n=1 Tax=Planctomicrobium piriforme TaxID=1576369 RepID=A0A1I3SCJ5_9PLAN|nr:hypothetical protein [Planctomicrobium piriforme]SFJ55271.1 Predicted esterase [Planctomicrobium piriforme]